MKKLLCLVAALLLLPSITLASILTHFNVLPSALTTSQALSYSSPNIWKELNQVYSGAACFSCFTRSFYSNDGLRPAKTAIVRWALDGPGYVRIVSFYTDATGQRIYDRTWPVAQANQINHPNLIGQNVTAKWNAIWSDPFLRAQEHNFLVEVYGSGEIYMARIEIDYQP